MKKYLQYNSIDFSQEQSFIRWAQGDTEIESVEDIDWSKWTNEHPEKKSEIEAAKKIVLSIKFREEQIPPHAEGKVWSKINASIDNKKENSPAVIPRRKLIRLLPYGIAAAIAILAIMTNVGDDYDTNIVTTLAQVETRLLPDGSEVIVNADSKLSYDEKSWDNNRTLNLSGEAFFKVKKGSKFIVKTEVGNVAVLGTSFNVYARDHSLRVMCETGKVSVSSKEKESILTPKKTVSITNGTHNDSKEVSAKESRSNWTSGVFIYNKAPLIEVIEEIERQLNVKIKVDQSLLSAEYSGSFDRKNKATALYEVFWPLGLKYEEKGNTVTVTK